MKRNDTARRGLNHYAGKSIEGANYRPSCGDCKMPPWELCSCSDLLSLNARIVEPLNIERTAEAAQVDSTAELFNLEADRRLSLALI